ncbi:MAG: hypothetical protein NVSMB70_03240 [Chamaesiphon sp.]
MYEAERQQIQIPNSSKEAFYKWFAIKTRSETQNLTAEGFFGVKFLEDIQFKLKAEEAIREEIKQEFKRKISDLVATINAIAATIYAEVKKDVIVIIDDLDKLDLAVAKEIYQDNIKALFQPNFRIILTIPVAALREVTLMPIIVTEANGQIVPMAVVKLFAKGERRLANADSQPESTAMLLEVLSKRIANELIEPQVAKQIIIFSGGVLRELIRIANVCCRICLRLVRREPKREDIKINDSVLQEALKELRIEFAHPLGMADYEILATTYKEFQPNDPKEQKFLNLLHALYILEYSNDQLWYDVHPIVTDILRQRYQI